MLGEMLIKGDKCINVAERNVQDLMGRGDSEVNTSSSPLVRGPVNPSRRGQVSQTCDDTSISLGIGVSAHVVG